MASITITVPDAQAARVLEAFAYVYTYDPAEGISKAEFARRQVAAYVRRTVVHAERDKAQREALAALLDPSEPDVS